MDIQVKNYWEVWFPGGGANPIRYRPKNLSTGTWWSTGLTGDMPVDYTYYCKSENIPDEVLDEIKQLREKHRKPVKHEFKCLIKDISTDQFELDMRVIGGLGKPVPSAAHGNLMSLCANRRYVKVTVEEIKE